MSRVAAIFRGGLARFIMACAAVYVALALETEAPQLILVMNGIALGMSAGVCFTYTPIVGSAMLARRPDHADYLGAGIWFLSASVFGMRLMSYIARDLAWPEIYNSDAVTAVLALTIVGAWFHLRAPDVVAAHVPQRGWVTGGATVAAGVFVAFLFAMAHRHTGGAPPVQLR